ncbi:MAG: radical SAM protein [Candidatus Margulisbacteria bacterium]|jgi:wyosine [tRNA(Phe)-imidazoG37] synthetase (radical SAM superfamily)|nr:radical SAM protein [Candidatus Margulisiibacteriota bacterium]
MARTGGNNNCLFGPVHSRRLGLSLGIDLLPFKTCTLDCVFCECGQTTRLTTERRVGVPTAQVQRELAAYFAHNPPPEVLTFSGGGEPTLAANLGEVIQEIKQTYPQNKLCLLTNSTLLSDPQVRREILPVDIIIPSFNAVSPEIFNQINRPAQGIAPADVMAGLRELKKVYAGKLLLEIFIVPGLNDTPQELARLRDFARLLGPDGIQLNSLDRKGTENWVKPLAQASLQKIKEFFGEFNTSCYLKSPAPE